MKTKFLLLISKIKSISEFYFTIITAIGVLWGGFVMYNNWRENNIQLQENVAKIIEKQSIQNQNDSILLKQQGEMKKQLSDIQSTTLSLQSSYVKYISNDKTLTKQDFLKYMEGLSFDVKKNSMTSHTTPTESLLIPSLK